MLCPCASRYLDTGPRLGATSQMADEYLNTEPIYNSYSLTFVIVPCHVTCKLLVEENKSNKDQRDSSSLAAAALAAAALVAAALAAVRDLIPVPGLDVFLSLPAALALVAAALLLLWKGSGSRPACSF